MFLFKVVVDHNKSSILRHPPPYWAFDVVPKEPSRISLHYPSHQQRNTRLSDAAWDGRAHFTLPIFAAALRFNFGYGSVVFRVNISIILCSELWCDLFAPQSCYGMVSGGSVNCLCIPISVKKLSTSLLMYSPPLSYLSVCTFLPNLLFVVVIHSFNFLNTPLFIYNTYMFVNLLKSYMKVRK